jgi:hypothetical protein
MQARAYGKRAIALTVTVGLVVLAAPSSAVAATQIGETFVPNSDVGGTPTAIQTVSPGGQYAAPSAGVITSWSFQAPASSVPVLKFKVARPAGGNSFTIIGEEGPQTPVAGMLNIYPTRIPVQAGDLIGLTRVVSGSAHFLRGAPSYAFHVTGGDPPPGTTATFSPGGNAQLDISASLEPDADNDGFGDETQDACPGLGGAANGCPPNTAITKGPKDKTRKRTATFEFAATGALAARQGAPTFQCKLDSGPFEPCTSPKTYRVKKGRHTFEVQATSDDFTDPTPATDDWKRKRKRNRG